VQFKSEIDVQQTKLRYGCFEQLILAQKIATKIVYLTFSNFIILKFGVNHEHLLNKKASELGVVA
jgi:hypothetical protein